jgi:hypothetical protein
MKQSWMSPRFVAVSVIGARSVVMRVFGVMSHGVILSSTLKKARIQPIVQGSDDVEHWSRRRGLVDTQRPARGEHLVERRTVPTLQSLSLVRAHQAEPNGSGNDSAQAHVEIQTQGVVARHIHDGKHGAEDRRQVNGKASIALRSLCELLDARPLENLGTSREKRPSLRSARAVRDVIGELRVESRIELPDAELVVVGSGGERQHGVPGIPN